MQSEIEKYMILITFISSFFTVFVLNGLMLGVPTIGAEFGMNNFYQNWILNIYTLIVTMLTIPAGQIAGKYGFKRTLSISNSLFLVGLIGSVIAISTETFLLSRIIQGIGIAFVNVCEIAIISLAISKENRGRALGIVVTGVYLGTSASPVICGFLVQNLGWRSIFYVSIIFIAICVILLRWKITPEWKTNEHDTIDKIGSLLWMVSITLVIYGFSTLITDLGKIFVVVGLILMAVYIMYELKQDSPVFDVNLFRTKSFTSYNLSGMFGYFAVMVFSTLINYYFQYVKGFDPQLTGLILIVSPVIMSITAPNAGKLSDRIHPQKIATVGMIIATSAMIILSFLNKDTPLIIVIIAMALQALGMGLFSSPNMNAIMSSVDEKDAAFASAGQLATRAIGQAMSVGLLTLIFSWIMGSLIFSTEYTDLIVSASHIIFMISAIACVASIITSVIGIRADTRITR